MQQIEKLEIVGFKSFCDRTQIDFNEGITAIVGPNGCGKSNIADAISWVVGEQSAKSLRTDRMEGVIFNGTQARKATGHAEVVLSLRLSPGTIVPEGLDVDPEGFSVGRRLYRSGESEYYLDGRRCRLKDIQALFEGTGLGPNSYALIEQGRIGQILSSKPADRRSLIEEAARITLFKSRRYSAEAKLQMAQQNLLRVQDIIREVERQLNSLKRQAAKARRYGRLREELRRIQKLKLAMEDRRLRSKLEDSEARLASAREKERAIQAELARLEAERTGSQERCRALEQALQEVRERLTELKMEAGAGESRLQSLDSQKTTAEGRLVELEKELLAIAEREDLIRRERERLERSRSALSEETAKESEELEAEQARNEVLQDAIRGAEASLEEWRSFLLSGAGRLSELKNEQTRCEENLQRIAARRKRLESEREEKVRERDVLREQHAELESRADARRKRAEALRSEIESAEERAAGLARRTEEVSDEVSARQEEHSLIQHRYSSLEEVERRRSNYSEGVQKFLSTLPGEEGRKPQTLADCVETDPAYEAAVEDYLNDPLQYILVDGLEDAVQSVERVKRIGAGRCTFLALRNGKNGHHEAPRPRLAGEGIVGYLDELLSMRQEVRQAFERALPECAATVMVTDLDTAFRLAPSNPGTSFLTLSGESYSPRGTLSAVGERKSMAGFLALKREKRELESRLGRLEGKLQAARAELSRVKEHSAEVTDQLKRLAEERRSLDVETAVNGHQIARVQEEIGRIDQVEHVAGIELEQLAEEASQFEMRLLEVQGAVEQSENRSRSGSEEMRELSARLESLKSESTALSRELAARQSTQAVRRERQSMMDIDLQRLGVEAQEARERREACTAEAAATRGRLAELGDEQVRLRERLETGKVEIQDAEADLADKLAQLSQSRGALTEREEESKGLQERREEAREVRSGIEVEKARLESDLEHVDRFCRDEFHCPLQEVAAGIEEADWQREYEEVAQTCEQLRERVENFGAINMRALEEYQELEQRHEFLTGQRTDIEKSIADTHKAIAEINRRSIEQFQNAFESIRSHFREVFQILFKGGQCDLRLLDESDVLESGVDIIAQPPGKRLQNVLLLSGGEKALTALALLIAIFRYRPSPFCVLDEVDAPLDDANVQRFTQLVLELSRETQFILITHNKKTMEVANILYGVTMEEPGVSKMVSVDFRRREPLAS